MERAYGGQNMVGRLRRVLLRAPDEAFGGADPERWHYTERPDLALARREHEAFAAIFVEAGVEVVHHDEPLADHADAIYVFDPAIVTDRGAVLLSMGKNWSDAAPAGDELENSGGSLSDGPELGMADGPSGVSYLLKDVTAGETTFVRRVEGFADDFDDVVRWVSPSILYSRMIKAGKLP